MQQLALKWQTGLPDRQKIFRLRAEHMLKNSRKSRKFSGSMPNAAGRRRPARSQSAEQKAGGLRHHR
jgi:hypothetical protein